MPKSHVPGDVDVMDVVLEDTDMSSNFTSMYFKEHILSPIMKGRVTINQFTGDMGKFDGTKPSKITFKTPEGDKRTYDSVLTDKLNNVSMDDAQRSRSFDVNLVSSHGILNNATKNFQKSFKNKEISSVIGDVLKNGLGLSIPLNIDNTKGLQGSDDQPMILTQKSPLMHIEDLRKLAISQNDYDGFVFFSGIGQSGKEELNFKSIYDLLKGNPVIDISNYTSFEMNSSLETPLMQNAMEIFLAQSNYGGLNKTGSFSQNATRYDINTGKFDIQNLKIGPARQELGSQTSLNPGKVSGYVVKPYNGMPGTKNVLLEDSRRPDSGRAFTAPYTESLFADMLQNFTTVKIPGNSNLKVGDVVNFEMRENTDSFLNKDTENYGKQLVIGVTNYIGPVSDRPRYVTYLDLVNIQPYDGVVS